MSKQQNNRGGRAKKDDTVMNESIRVTELRVLGDDGEQFGIISRADAIQIAEDKGLDLVVVSPDAKPPVAKVMDYGKHKYEVRKKEKEDQKKYKKRLE